MSVDPLNFVRIDISIIIKIIAIKNNNAAMKNNFFDFFINIQLLEYNLV
jgi:hypothetical protein